MTPESVKKHNIRFAKFLCGKNGCSEKETKLHYDQIVHRAWNPHPSPEFVAWWNTHPDFREHGIDAIRARNCESYVNEYKEAIAIGLANLPNDYPK